MVKVVSSNTTEEGQFISTVIKRTQLRGLVAMNSSKFLRLDLKLKKMAVHSNAD